LRSTERKLQQEHGVRWGSPREFLADDVYMLPLLLPFPDTLLVFLSAMIDMPTGAVVTWMLAVTAVT